MATRHARNVLTAFLVCFTAAGASGSMEGLQVIDPAKATNEFGEDMLWYDIQELDLEGKGWGDTAHLYDRLPRSTKTGEPGQFWGLVEDSAGMCVRFVTDSPRIGGRWTLRSSNLAMPHMPATGVSGLDLYVNDNGTWRWIGAGRPATGMTHQAVLAEGIPEGSHEFMVYLPLYNGVESVQIGIEPSAKLAKGPAYPAGREKPILFWGTSILQGGCASRPGMAYPAIVGRMLMRPTINLGFSGNGKMQPEVVDALTRLDAAAFVIDCCPNMDADLIMERTIPLVTALRKAWPDTPIVLVENVKYQAGAFLPKKREAYEVKNKAFRAQYEQLAADGVKGLHYVPCDDLFGHDGEATVDGTHATDLGFLRIAEVIAPVLQGILGE